MKNFRASNKTIASNLKRSALQFSYLKWKLVMFLVILLLISLFIQSIELWKDERIHYFVRPYFKFKSSYADVIEIKAAAYSMQGRRPSMEDRFVINTNVRNTDIGLFGVFDGHGGSKCVQLVIDIGIPYIYKRIETIYEKLNESRTISNLNCQSYLTPRKKFNPTEKSKSFITFYNEAKECIKTKCQVTDSLKNKVSTLKTYEDVDISLRKQNNDTCYITNGNINFATMLMDELLVVDDVLNTMLRKAKDDSGSTAVIAIVNKNILTLANIGDSRAVICDRNGLPNQMTTDHHATNPMEQQRILEAGGFVATDFQSFRTLGLISITRSLGDSLFKKFIIAEPEIVTYDLALNRPIFLIIACDGVWAAFSNEQAVAFVRNHFHESDFGAKSLAKEAYNRNSHDNLTVLIIAFINGEQLIGQHSGI